MNGASGSTSAPLSLFSFQTQRAEKSGCEAQGRGALPFSNSPNPAPLAWPQKGAVSSPAVPGPPWLCCVQMVRLLPAGALLL